MPLDVEFKHKAQKWYQYERFYTTHARGAIVQFDTGELMVRKYKFDPDERSRRSEFGTQFVAPHDMHDVLHRVYDSNGTHILKTWLSQNDVFLVDYETKQLVALHYSAPRNVAGVPEIPECIANFGAYAYCSGPKRKWVSTGRVHYRTPAKLDKAQKEHLKEALNLVRTQQRVGALPTEDKLRYGVLSEMRGMNNSLVKRDPLYHGPVPYEFALNVPVAEMTEYERLTLAKFGYATLHDFHKVDELRID